MMILATAPRIRRLRGGAGDSTVTTGTAPRIRILRPEGAAQRGRRRDSSAHTEIKGLRQTYQNVNPRQLRAYGD